MKIDLTCPVELWQYAMPTEDGAECTFVMNNLSDKVVTSVQVTLSCFDAEDLLLFRQTERIQGLKAGVGERFSILLVPTQWENVQGVDLVIEKVWFDDAGIWRRGNAPLTQYTPNNLPNGRALDELRFVAGKDALGYPQMQEQVWVCVCGRANPLDSQRCCRCERRKDSVFASCNPQNVQHVIAAHEQKLSETARRAREDNSRIAETLEKQRTAKKRRRVKTVKLALSVLCLVAVGVVAVVWGVPTIRYNAALDLLKNDRYDEARTAFAEMGEYRDAQTQLTECDYQEANDALMAGDVESLQKAADGFAALGDYSDSADLWKQATYELGDHYLTENAYESAAECFQSLGEYEDSADKLREATYRQADALLQSGNYDIARALFGTLGEYRDSQTRVQQTVYQQGKTLFEGGDYEAAIATLSPLGTYDNAAELVQQAHYQLAETAMLAEDYETAGNHYLLAGTYSDAVAKGNECLYQHAQSLKAAGSYQEAAALFGRIPDYLDSEGQARSCVYEQAMAAMQSEDYASAAALLETITTYDDAQAQLYECNYRLAMAAIEQSDNARAETLLEQAGGYSDSDRQLRTVRYQLAQEAQVRGDYAYALERYEALGSYRDSASSARACRYEIAKAALESGDYQAAVDGFTALGRYEDSRTLLEEAQLKLAQQLSSAGDTQSAMQALSALDSDEAKAELATLILAEGQKLEEAGDLQAASLVYLPLLEQNAEVTARYNACQYAIAQGLREAGDFVGAGSIFLSLGNYEDAEAQGEACYASHFGEVADRARAAMEQADYVTVIQALDGFNMTDLPAQYADLPDLFNEACYQHAEALYREDRPFEALPFYRRIMDYKDVTDRKLSRSTYRLLGAWESATGLVAVFNADGTCDMMGEARHFRASSFSLYTGETADGMTLTHNITSLTQSGLTLRDIRDGQDTVYRFTRTAEPEWPAWPYAEDEVPAAQPTSSDGSEWAVTDDEPTATPQPEATPAAEPTETPAVEDEHAA